MNTGGIKDNAHIFKCLDVSTAHITEKDNELLGLVNVIRFQEGISLSVYAYEYGWFIYSGDGATSEADFTRMEEAGFSKELLNLIRTAHEKGCKFLTLDCDGPVYNDLPQFDW